MKQNKLKRNLPISITLIILFVVIGFFVMINVLQNTNKREVIATVSEKEVKNSGNDGKYLIFTKDDDVDVYEITDTLFQGRWNSSDLYGSIEKGKTYKFTIVGIRNRFMSMYPNILSAEEITKETIPDTQN